MKKDIEWLKNEVDKLPLRFLGFSMLKQREEFTVNKDDVLELINQLDEPEVLSKEWIDENEVFIFDLDDDCEIRYVPSLKLRHLLVPEQELPVIPKFVADWLEEYKEDELIITAGTVIGNRRFPKDTKVGKWLNEDYVKNSEIFAQAWLAYPNVEVEEEPQYRLKAGKNYLYFNLDGTVRGATKDNATITKERLEQLPFDVEKAVESGIIEVEELEE